MAYIPGKGDIVRINFDPSVGKEIMKYRSALVLTPEKFNDQMGLVLVVPISNTVRGMGLEVGCPKPMSTTGVAQTWQVRSFDWVERKAKFVEKSPKRFVVNVIKKSCPDGRRKSSGMIVELAVRCSPRALFEDSQMRPTEGCSTPWWARSRRGHGWNMIFPDSCAPCTSPIWYTPN